MAGKMNVYNEMVKAQLENLSADPTGVIGMVYFNTTSNIGKLYNGTVWNTLLHADFSNVTGTLAVANGGTGITSFGANVATFLGTPSSANLAAAVTDETGSGALVFATSPTLVTPALGTPSSVTLTNGTGLPIDGGTVNTLPISRGGTGQTSQTSAFDALAPTTTNGDLIYHNGTDNVRLPIGTDGQALKVLSGIPAWGDGGAGAGEINAILNPSAASATTGWSNGTSHTVTRVTSGSPLDPIITTAFRGEASAAATESSTSGQYYVLTLPTGLESKKLKVEFYLTTPSTDAWKVSVYDGTTRLALSTDSSGSTTLPAGVTGKFVTYFDATANNTYTVSLTKTSHTASSQYLFWTNIIVGPGIQPQGAVVGPTITSVMSLSGSPVKGTTQTDKFSYVRIGEWMHAQFEYRQTGAGTNGSGTISLNLPSGLSVSSSALTGVSTGITQVGTGYAFNGATEYPLAVTASGGATSVTLFDINTSNSFSGLTYTDVSFANATAVLSGSFSVPIAEWAGSGTVNLAQNDVEYASTTEAWTSTGTTTSYSQAGQQITGALSANVTKTVTWQNPPQKSDVIQLQLSLDGTTFFDASQRAPFILDSATAVDTSAGARISSTSATTTTVQFCRYQYIANDDSPVVDWTNGMYWRVIKFKSGQAVGFGMATATQSGLLQPVTSQSDALATQRGNKQYTTGVTYNNSTQVTFSSTPAGWALTYAYFVPYQMQDGSWRCRANVSATWTSTATPSVVINLEALTNAQAAYASAGTTPAYSYGFITRTGSQTSNLEWRFGSAQTGGTWAADFALNAKPTWAY